MKRLVLLIGLTILLTSDAAIACGRCRVARAHPRRVVSQPRTVTAYAPAVTDPSPQVVYAPAMASAQPVPAPTVGIPAPTSVVTPTYTYSAANGESPAYYYSYDNSGKMIVSQWVDWVFRGGRAEGMPRPPLPIIGNFRADR